jgi:ATP-binding cassette subfamily B (MDR/TAP) protein 7
MQSMFDLTAIKSSVRDKTPQAPNLIISPTTSNIVFDKVRFQYEPGQDLFRELSFEVPSGKKIAIVGGSGSGKSTIVRLLYRFYDPLEGRILINNQDLRDVSINSLRKAIGIVPQVIFCIKCILKFRKLFI